MEDASKNVYVVAAVTAIVVLVAGYFVLGFGSSSDTSSESLDLSKKKKDKKKSADKFPAGQLTVYFGSQTGTAEGFARTVMEETRELGFDTKTADLEDFEPEALAETKVAVFLMATYGEGEPTDNATRFLAWVRNADESVESSFLSKTSYMVFGLGNTQYEHYNKMGIYTDEFLEKLGASRVLELGLGDDNATLEDDFDAWKQKMLATLMSKYHPSPSDHGYTDEKISAVLGGSAESLTDELKLPGPVKTHYSARILPAGGNYEPDMNPSGGMNTSTKHFFTAPEATILVNRELRTQPKKGPSVGSTRHIEVSLENTGLVYDTADNFAILPENNAEMVNQVASRLGYNLDDVFDLEASEDGELPKACYPTPCTVRDLLTRYLDIQGAPRHSFMLQLHPYLSSSEQKAWLENLLAKSNKEAYKDFMHKSCSSFCSLLCNELSSLQIPLTDLMHLLPFIQPRFYTIASSSSEYPDTVHLTIAITEMSAEQGRSKRTIKGLCTGYCETLKAGDSFRVFIRNSSFRLPQNIATPITMIGPGTGIAPMRALLQERYYQSLHGPTLASDANDPNRRRARSTSMDNPKSKPVVAKTTSNEKHEVGKNTLYFGCKHAKQDYIYREELEDYRDNKKILNDLHLAFSRDDPKKKVYVQHLLAQEANAKALLESLDNGGYIFVCGATAMGADVMEAITGILTKYRPAEYTTKEEAHAYLMTLQESGRYVQELWSA